MHDPHDERTRGDDHREHDVVQRDVVRQVEHAEQVAARHALQPVLAVRERRLQVDEVDHLRERERDHREIDALPPDREQADDEPQQRGRRRAGEHAELRREAERLDRVAGRVAGAREEHRMAERQQPRIADQQVERGREQREREHLHHEHRIRADERRRQQRGEQRAVKHFSLHHFSLPNRPAGRNSSTIAMITNTTVADASG